MKDDKLENLLLVLSAALSNQVYEFWNDNITLESLDKIAQTYVNFWTVKVVTFLENLSYFPDNLW